MLVGIPSEVEEDESRVAITPQAWQLSSRNGHDFVLQKDAGAGRAIRNEAYRRGWGDDCRYG